MMYKTKMLFASVIIVLMLLIILTACASGYAVVSERVIKKNYTPATVEIVTEYGYKYSWWHGDFILVPEVKTVEVPEQYVLTVEQKLEDGQCVTRDYTVSKAEYEAVGVGDAYGSESGG